MNGCLRRRIGVTLSAAVFLLNYSPWVRAEAQNLIGEDAAQTSAQVSGRMQLFSSGESGFPAGTGSGCQREGA